MRKLLIIAASASALSFPAQAAFLEMENMAEADLEETRGMGGLDPNVFNVANLRAVNSGNTIENPVTGDNLIGMNAFQNAQGVISVVQNSGNGVVIQNSTIVNLSLQ